MSRKVSERSQCADNVPVSIALRADVGTRSSCISPSKSQRLPARSKAALRGAKSGAASSNRPTKCDTVSRRCRGETAFGSGLVGHSAAGSLTSSNLGRKPWPVARKTSRKRRSIRRVFTRIVTRAIASGGCPASRVRSPATNASEKSTPRGSAKTRGVSDGENKVMGASAPAA